MIQKTALSNGFDPLTLIAVIESESGWDPSVINYHRTGTYIGLGQHRAGNYEECSGEALVDSREDDKGKLSQKGECSTVVQALLDWRFNIEQTAQAFVMWREMCGERVGSKLAVHWMQGYKGFDAQRKTVCGHKRGKPLKVPDAVLKVLERRKELERESTRRHSSLGEDLAYPQDSRSARWVHGSVPAAWAHAVPSNHYALRGLLTQHPPS